MITGCRRQIDYARVKKGKAVVLDDDDDDDVGIGSFREIRMDG